MSDGVYVERMSDGWRDNRLKRVLSVLETSPTARYSQVLEQTKTVSVNREHFAVKRVHHHAAGGLQANTGQGNQVTLQLRCLKRPQLSPR